MVQRQPIIHYPVQFEPKHEMADEPVEQFSSSTAAHFPSPLLSMTNPSIQSSQSASADSIVIPSECFSRQQPLDENQLIPSSVADQRPHSASVLCASSSSVGPASGAPLTCTVCGDVATGRHYGSVACNGCKGFFRRTIRRGYKYTCRFTSNCQIDKHNRAVCRACRYARCIQFGMKVDAVQSERDLIGKRSRTFPSGNTLGLTVSPPAGPSSVALDTQAEGESRGTLSPEQSKSLIQQKMERRKFDLLEPSSVVVTPSNSPCSVPSYSMTSSAHFVSHHQTSQQQFSSFEESDESIPRKRSFSSGSKRHLREASCVTSAAVAEQQQQQLEASATTAFDDHLLNSDDPWNGRNGRALLRQLLCSEEKIRNMRETVIAQTCNLEYINKGDPNRSQLPIGENGTRKANENDILQSLHSQLLLVIEWAKTLKPFAELPTEDQTALLKNFAAQHVVLCVAYRSTSDFLTLINDSCIPRIANGDDKDLFYRKDAERVMDLLVSPMRFLRVDDVEFVSMKACILFNPVARGLSPHSVMSVLKTRRQIFQALQHYVQAKMPPDEDRIGDLTFFILSPLQSLAKAVSEDVLVSKLSGVARLDQLMEELILEDNDPKEPDAPLAAPSSKTIETDSTVTQQLSQYDEQTQQNHLQQQPQIVDEPHFSMVQGAALPQQGTEPWSAFSSYVLGSSLQSGSPHLASSHEQLGRDSTAMPSSPRSSAVSAHKQLPSSTSSSSSSSSHHNRRFTSSSLTPQRNPVQLWAQQIGSNMLYGNTPSTPGQAIYSGTSPSPPQRFDFSSAGGGLN